MTKKTLDGKRYESASAWFEDRLGAERARKVAAIVASATGEDAGADLPVRRMLDKIVIIAGNYAKFIVAPRHFAAVRRLAGDATAAPEDYDCTCPVRDADGVPICLRLRPACKFAGLRRNHNDSPNDFTGLSGAWFAIHREKQAQIVTDLPFEKSEELAAELALMVRALRKANKRRRKSMGAPFDMANTVWCS